MPDFPPLNGESATHIMSRENATCFLTTHFFINAQVFNGIFTGTTCGECFFISCSGERNGSEALVAAIIPHDVADRDAARKARRK